MGMRYEVLDEQGEVINRILATPEFMEANFQHYREEMADQPSLEDLKASKIAQINALRDQKETEGFTYLGHVWDSDERSVTRIYGAVMAAQAAIAAGAPEAFSITWTFADNSTAELTAEQMIGAPVAMAARADALHQYARTLKQTVAEAEDKQALEAIDIEAGWPNV